MATKIETLKKPNGDQVLPRTHAKAVSMESGTTVETAIADINTNIDSLIVADEKLINEISAERARINQFVALEEGSTTGDAELQDIRVGYNGTVYNSAGDAVRGQISMLADEFAFAVFSDNKFDNNYNATGYYDASTGELIENENYLRTINFYELGEIVNQTVYSVASSSEDKPY